MNWPDEWSDEEIIRIKRSYWKDYEIMRLIELGEDYLVTQAANIRTALSIIRKRKRREQE